MAEIATTARHRRLPHTRKAHGRHHQSNDFKKLLRFYKGFGFDAKAAREWTDRTLTAFKEVEHELAGT